jgi:hypothetical protein
MNPQLVTDGVLLISALLIIIAFFLLLRSKEFKSLLRNKENK